MPLNCKILRGVKGVCWGGGVSGHITCGFQGGGNVFTFSLEGVSGKIWVIFSGGGVRQNLGNEPRSQPLLPLTLNNERPLTTLVCRNA